MEVSIIICTRDRAEDLRQTLLSVAKSCVPSGMICELLIVDNGSSDSTAHVARSCCEISNIPVRYLYEARCGLSRARNTGINAARGSVILFTDDDVRPPKQWMEEMCRPILNGNADAIAGGVVFPPHIAKLLNAGLLSNRKGYFASTEDIDVNNPERMVGANMAFGRHILERVPAFDVRLGGGALGFGDDTLFSKQIKAAGYRIGGAIHSAVEHHFDTSRLTRSNLLKIAEKMGSSEAYLQHHWEHADWGIKKRQLIRSRLGLWRRRLVRPTAWLLADRLEEWEFERVQYLAFMDQYLKEVRLCRRYPARAIASVEKHSSSMVA